jgi:hypothetical protein
LGRSEKPRVVPKLKGTEIVPKIRLHLSRATIPTIDDQNGTLPEPLRGVEQLRWRQACVQPDTFMNRPIQVSLVMPDMQQDRNLIELEAEPAIVLKVKGFSETTSPEKQHVRWALESVNDVLADQLLAPSGQERGDVVTA